MLTASVPYHLDRRLDGFDPGPVDVTITAALPDGGPWPRMAVLYEQVAAAVVGAVPPSVVITSDCTTSLGVLAGLQRAGHDAGVVWLDAHADFQTEQTTSSGYLGGMPLALLTGVGTLTLPGLLRLRPVPAATLVGARDVEPQEEVLLAGSAVRRCAVGEPVPIPDGPVYLHVDLDVGDPAEVPDLLYPAPGGPSLDAVLDAVGAVMSSGRVVAVGLALTWLAGSPHAGTHRTIRDRFRTVVGA